MLKQTIYEKLNPNQRMAVEETDHPLLVLAGAGSGKTRVITAKIAYLIHEKKLSPRQIVAVTFTNKAAKEMRERVSLLLESKQKQGLVVSTFHTLGLSILKKESQFAEIYPGFTIFDAHDSLQLIREIGRQQKLEMIDPVRHVISKWKNERISPELAFQEALDEESLQAARVYTAYEKALRAYHAVDFDDLIVIPAHILSTYSEVRERWQNRVRYLLVDEYQDTNACQYALMRCLSGVTGKLTAVGDDDQSIYAWRGADVQNIQRLHADFPALKIIKLEQNYRSTITILRHANQLIANNSHIHEKKLWSHIGEGDPVRVVETESPDVEAQRVVSEILKRHFRDRCEWGDFAILYRGNHQSRPVEKWLREQRIPYQITGGNSFFEQPEIRDLMAYLRLLTHPEDDAAFLRVVNVPRRGVGVKSLETLRNYAAKRQSGLWLASGELGLSAELSERIVGRLREFSDWLSMLREQVLDPALNIRGLMNRMLQDIGYENWLFEQYENPKVVERKWSNIHELIDWLERLEKDETGKSLAERIDHLRLIGMLERNSEKEIENVVRLMTLHAAKGLEFKHVFLIGMEEEILPHRTSLEAGDLEEERRLAYVGMTRAQVSLTLTYCRYRSYYDEKKECEPSRFLSELPSEGLDWPRNELPVEKKREIAKTHFADMKALLDE